MAAGDPVRTAIEKYCKSRRIRTESRQVAETTIHDERELWRLGLQLVTGTLGKCTLGLWALILDYWAIWNWIGCVLWELGFSSTLEASVLQFQFGTSCILGKRIPN